jgi:hypothetical protein
MFPFPLLCPPRADHMLGWSEGSVRGTPAVRVKTANAPRCEQGFQRQPCLIVTPTEDVRYHLARPMIQRLPQPPRPLLAADKGPHFIQFGLLHLVEDNCGG